MMLKEEYDFSKGERGKFFNKDVVIGICNNIPKSDKKRDSN